MGKQQVIRLVASLGVCIGLAVTSLQAQPPGGGGPPLAELEKLPTPRLADGKPDLTGSWQQAAGGQRGAPGGMFRRCGPWQNSNCMEWTNQSTDFAFQAPMRLDPNQPLYKPEYWDKVIALDQWTNRDDPVMTCLPLGNQQFNVHTFPRKVIQTPGVLLLLYETHQGIRQVFTDGRSIPKDDPQPWFYGYSVGRWEGDTLVVETAGFKDGGWLDINGSPLTEQGRTIERFRRPNFGTIEIEQTIDDPKAYTRPFTTRLTWQLMPDTEIMEMVCLENNQSIHHLVGKDGPAQPVMNGAPRSQPQGSTK